jgi:hypothetical protein
MDSQFEDRKGTGRNADEEQVTEEEMARLEELYGAHLTPGERRANALKDLGMPPVEYCDEREAPPIDHELIHRVVLGQASEEEQRQVLDLELHYRSWQEAVGICAEAVEEADRESRNDPGTL